MIKVLSVGLSTRTQDVWLASRCLTPQLRPLLSKVREGVEEDLRLSADSGTKHVPLQVGEDMGHWSDVVITVQSDLQQSLIRTKNISIVLNI